MPAATTVSCCTRISASQLSDGSSEQAAISRVVIERPAGRARVTIHAGRGLIIGKKGQDIERLRADLSKRVGSESPEHRRGPQA